MSPIKGQIIFTLFVIALQVSSASYNIEKTPGEHIDIFNAPYIVQVWTQAKKFLCSGTIYSEWHVVTAASCILNGLAPLKQLGIRVNSTIVDSNTSDMLEIERAYLHPTYTGELFKKDAAVLKLKNKLKFGRGVRKIDGFCDFPLVEGKSVDLFGWTTNGRENNQHLQTISSTALNYNICPDNAREIVTKNTLCAAVDPKSHMLSQFTGGPLIHRGQFCGIATRSFGVYTDINEVDHFIRKAIEDAPELDYLM